MNVYCLGVSHHTASIRLRECLSLEGAARKAALAAFTRQREAFAPLSELAILSTCSRLEVYAVAASQLGEDEITRAFTALQGYMQAIFNIQDFEIEPYLYRLAGEKVVRHLSRVAASLDSMVLGDPQILGQVSEAHATALAEGSARHVLSSLFRTAIHAGKRVRTETSIGRHPTNMSAVAIRLAERSLGSLAERRALVLGTGEIGQQSLATLRGSGVSRLIVASRSPERARLLAESWSAQPVQTAQIAEVLPGVDLVLASTTSAQVVITRTMVEAGLSGRTDRRLVLVDLALPRNIDPDVRKVPGAELYDLDDIQAFVENSRARRKNEVPRAEAIVNEEAASFLRWLAVIPVVGELHRRAEAIRQQEVERTLQHLPEVPPEVMQQIEVLSQSLVRKLLHEPTARLRSEADHQNLDEYVNLVSTLFGLSDGGLPETAPPPAAASPAAAKDYSSQIRSAH